MSSAAANEHGKDTDDDDFFVDEDLQAERAPLPSAEVPGTADDGDNLAYPITSAELGMEIVADVDRGAAAPPRTGRPIQDLIALVRFSVNFIVRNGQLCHKTPIPPPSDVAELEYVSALHQCSNMDAFGRTARSRPRKFRTTSRAAMDCAFRQQR